MNFDLIASELLENIEEMFLMCFIDNDVIQVDSNIQPHTGVVPVVKGLLFVTVQIVAIRYCVARIETVKVLKGLSFHYRVDIVRRRLLSRNSSLQGSDERVTRNLDIVMLVWHNGGGGAFKRFIQNSNRCYFQWTKKRRPFL